MASLEVDQMNKSYYGEQNLYLVAINGDSCMVPLGKNGPVYTVKWNPNGKEFAACYGFMPARVRYFVLFFCSMLIFAKRIFESAHIHVFVYLTPLSGKELMFFFKCDHTNRSPRELSKPGLRNSVGFIIHSSRDVGKCLKLMCTFLAVIFTL